MEANAEPEHQMMIEDGVSQIYRIDPKRARFPCCIVWTPLPVLSWLIPFIGHIGICREDGVILDFAGPNFVCVDDFTFGSVARYIQIDKEKVYASFHMNEDYLIYLPNIKETIPPPLITERYHIGYKAIGEGFDALTSIFPRHTACINCCISPHLTSRRSEDQYTPQDEGGLPTWDNAIQKSTQEFQHQSYNLLTCNCHSFVANSLNRLGFRTGGWNVVNLAALIFLKGKWVDKAAMVRSFLPFIIVFGLGISLGASKFLTFLAFFTFILVGWFLIGTYCFKSLIHL